VACVSGWHDKALAVGLFAQPRRLVKRCAVAQRGVANARQLVRQRAGGLVVTASPLHIQRPAAHALYLLARPLRHLGRSQHTARAMREQHAQVAVALLGDAPQVAAAARAVLAWRQAKPTGEVACVLEVCHVARGGCPTKAVAVSSPMPGIDSSSVQAGLCLAARLSCLSTWAMRASSKQAGESIPSVKRTCLRQAA
jgi:hypothetical protein